MVRWCLSAITFSSGESKDSLCNFYSLVKLLLESYCNSIVLFCLF